MPVFVKQRGHKAGPRRLLVYGLAALLLPLGYVWLQLQTSGTAPAGVAVHSTIAAAQQPSLIAKVYAIGSSSLGPGSSSGSAAARSRAVLKGSRVAKHPECEGTLGSWCNEFKSQTPIEYKEPPLGTKHCLWGCNFVGVCDATTGSCRCPAGWQGEACDRRRNRKCSQHFRQGGFEPSDAPIDWHYKGATLACAGYCDEDLGFCFCNSTFPYGRIPAPNTEPPGTPPVRFGRPMSHGCQPKADPHGVQAEDYHFGEVSYDHVFGEQGWCVAEKPAHGCPCHLDGLYGPTCEVHAESFCVNQCSGHGECNIGFCKCHDGWYGIDCAQRAEGTPWSRGLVESRPWLKDVALLPAAEPAAAGKTRLRPLIYIYDLTPEVNAQLLQYRFNGQSCTHRLFHPDNATWLTNWVYSSETGFHEYLAQSPHRTLDPEEADFFYIPAYPGCYAWPVFGASDHPWFHGGPAANRAQSMTNIWVEAHHWVRSRFPYWDRRGGKDHIILAAHDEASCHVPAVLRPAIMLAHYGSTRLNNHSDTAWGPDLFAHETVHKVYQPEGHLSKLGSYPCYDPEKDLTIPLVWAPIKYAEAPLFGNPSRKREYLATFKGRIQPWLPNYSRGVRQRLANLTAERGWWEEHRIYIGESNPPGVDASYSGLLASSVFCFVLMGDGWSARFDDAIINGCIPVTIMEEVHHSFETIIDPSKISVRIDPTDLDHVPDILKAISKNKVEEMQRNIAKVWRRFMYSGLKSHANVVNGYLKNNKEKALKDEGLSLPPPEVEYNPEEDDAFATIIQWLYSRIPLTR